MRYPYNLDQWRNFVAMICDSPEDDGVRLVAADWLEEHGESDRAEFVRLGVELKYVSYEKMFPKGCIGTRATERGAKCACGACDKSKYLRYKVLHYHLARFIWGKLATFLQEVRFCRGWPETVICSAADWLTHGDAILAEHPITAVTLTTWPTLDSLTLSTDLRFKFTNNSKEHRLNTNVMLFEDASQITQMLRMEWPRVKTWTLPPRHTVSSILRLPNPVIDEAIRRSGEIIESFYTRGELR